MSKFHGSRLMMDKRPSQAQIRLIETLAIDLAFDRKSRQAHISTIVGRIIYFPDELSMLEASSVITQFKKWKENEQEIPVLPISRGGEEESEGAGEDE